MDPRFFRKYLNILDEEVVGKELARTSGGEFKSRADRLNQAKIDAILGPGYKAGRANTNLALARHFRQQATDAPVTDVTTGNPLAATGGTDVNRMIQLATDMRRGPATAADTADVEIGAVDTDSVSLDTAAPERVSAAPSLGRGTVNIPKSDLSRSPYRFTPPNLKAPRQQDWRELERKRLAGITYNQSDATSTDSMVADRDPDN